MRKWRIHLQDGSETRFDYCQNQLCPKPHYITAFRGSRPARDSWEGMLDSDGKVPK